MIKETAKISLHGKECFATRSLATAKVDIEGLTGRRTENVPYIYSSPEVGYCVTDNGRFFTVKMAKSLYRYVIMENEWHIKERAGRKRNPHVIATAGDGKRVELDIAKCVYCAFVAQRWIDERLFLDYKDGNNQNPVLSNIEYKPMKSACLVSYSAQSWKRNYQRFLTRVVCEVDISLEDAEDCVQTAFLEAFVNTCPYGKWLKSETAKDEQYKREVLWRQWSWQNAVMLAHKQRKAIDIDARMQLADEMTEIHEESGWMLEAVTPGQRRVLELYLDGYSECEIATAMKYKHLASVRNTIGKAIANIQTKLTAI